MTESTPSIRNEANRLPGLDLLRAIAITWVMLFHASIVGILGGDFAWLSRYGWAGVDIFFALSGYLIGVQVLRPLHRTARPELARFYVRRAWRILPAFAVVLVVYVFFPALRESPDLRPWWQFATFTSNLFVDDAHPRAFSHAWSLCVEEHFYLVFPMIAAWLFRRPSKTRFAAVCAGVIIGGIVLRTSVWLHDAHLDPSRTWFIDDIYYPTWMRFDGMLMGVMLATLRVYRPDVWARAQRHANAGFIAGCALLALAFWLFRDRTGLAGTAIGWPILSAGCVLVVFAGADRNSVIGRRHLPGVAWIAGISYSLYLSHKLAMHAVSMAFDDGSGFHARAAFVVYAAAIVIVGAALHYLVERPFLRWRDRASGRSRDVTVAAAAA